MAAALAVAVAAGVVTRALDGRGASEAPPAAAGAADPSPAGARSGLDAELAAARALSEALPEDLVPPEARAELAAAIAAAEARESAGAAGGPRSDGTDGAAAPEGEETARELARHRAALEDGAEDARAALVSAVAGEAETLAGASPEALATVADASDALAGAGLPESAPAATALAAALAVARAEHEAAAAAEREAAERARSSADTDDPASIAVVVNKQRPLRPVDWEPADLRLPSGIPNTNGQPVRDEAATALEAMYAEASAAGVPFTITSAFRGYALQTSLFESYAARDGVAAAETYSARPGHSEHQTGLAVDLDDGSGCAFESCFGETATGQWLRANAHRFGFILRYDDGEQPVVGFIYEPWHFRYVGAEVAGDMHARGVANLEDYFGLPAAPGY